MYLKFVITVLAISLSLIHSQRTETRVSSSSSSSASARSTVSAQSSVQVSGTSSADLQAQLQSAADTALKELEESPDDLNNVLQQLAQVLLTEIGNLMITIFDGGEIDASAVAEEISSAVGEAIQVAASAGTTFQDLDVDSITSEIQTNVESTLSGLDADADIGEVTQEVASSVLNAIGNALAEETGQTFSFELSVESSQATVDEATTSGVVTTGGVSQSEFETQFASKAQDALAELEANPDDLNNVMSQVTTILLQSIQSLLVNITTGSDINAEDLTTVISTAVENVLTQLASASSTYADLDVDSISTSVQSDLESIFSTASSESNVDAASLTEQIASAVIAIVGSELAEISGVQFSFTISTTDATDTTTANATDTMTANATQSDALSPDVLLQVSEDIMSALKDTDEVMKLIQDAAEKKQTLAISVAFLSAIEVGAEEDIKSVLTSFFTDEKITTETIRLVLTATISQGGKDAADAIIDAIRDTKDLSKLSAVFRFAFTTEDSDVTDTFSTLVKNSVSRRRCGLSKVIREILEEATPTEVDQIVETLKNADADVCIPKKFSAPATPDSVPSTEDTEAEPETTIAATPDSMPSTEDAEAKSETTITDATTTNVSVALTPVPEDTVITPVSETESITTTIINTLNRTTDDEDQKEEAAEIPTAEDVSTAVITEQLVAPTDEETTPSPTLVAPTDEETTPSPTLVAPTDEETTASPILEPILNEDGECVDIVPPGNFTCAQQYRYGKCERKWMRVGGFCAKTCGFCSEQQNCTDVAPDDKYTCAEQKQFGKCDFAWMIDSKFCEQTCGRCGNTTDIEEIVIEEAAAVVQESINTTIIPVSTSEECNCECSMDAEVISQIVTDVVTQVLIEINA